MRLFGGVSEALMLVYVWRVIATASSFLLFGVAGGLLGLFLLPVSLILHPLPFNSQHLGRSIVRIAFKTFVGYMRFVGLMTYEIRGVSRLGRPGQLIVANHPSLIDAVFLIAFSPTCNCVVKGAMWRNPLTAGVASSAGYIPNDPTYRMIEKACAALRQEDSLLMFPEGTRTTPGQPMQFRRGAANIAMKAARVLTPVFISVSPTTLTKGERWYQVPARRPHFTIEVGDDISLADYSQFGALPLASRKLNDALVEKFVEWSQSQAS